VTFRKCADTMTSSAPSDAAFACKCSCNHRVRGIIKFVRLSNLSHLHLQSMLIQWRLRLRHPLKQPLPAPIPDIMEFVELSSSWYYSVGDIQMIEFVIFIKYANMMTISALSDAAFACTCLCYFEVRGIIKFVTLSSL